MNLFKLFRVRQLIYHINYWFLLPFIWVKNRRQWKNPLDLINYVRFLTNFVELVNLVSAYKFLLWLLTNDDKTWYWRWHDTLQGDYYNFINKTQTNLHISQHSAMFTYSSAQCHIYIFISTVPCLHISQHSAIFTYFSAQCHIHSTFRLYVWNKLNQNWIIWSCKESIWDMCTHVNSVKFYV
jgi:hypothetical protein